MNEMIVKPAYLSDPSVVVDNSDLNLYSKPPQIKVIQAQTGPPYRPPFKAGDIIIKPSMIKIGDGEVPFSFAVIHFFPSWICMNPLEMKGQLSTVREFSLDPTSDVAIKAKTFVKERCPENTDLFLKYSETLNFMVVVEDNPELSDIPIHLFFARGEYGTGQKLIGMLQAHKVPRYAYRFRAVSGAHQNKKGQTWEGLDIFNDPQHWVTEENFKKYEVMYKELKKLIDSRTIDIDTSDPEVTEAPEM